MRRPIVAGNWKMNKTAAEAGELAGEVARGLSDAHGVDVVVCPPFTAMAVVRQTLEGSAIQMGAQNMHWETSGAYTGEISASMLRDLGCGYVILGHSERRAYFGETDQGVNRKAKAALEAELQPIVCVGETLEQREVGSTESVVETQVRQSLAGLTKQQMQSVIVAYEPVWAIGTGRTATPDQAQEVHALIRKVIASMVGEATAQGLRIQYGGSVKPSNAKELFGQPDIDGGLIGGAALEARSFVDIVLASH